MGVPARTWAQISPAAAEQGTQDAGARRVRGPGTWGGDKGVLPNPGRAEDSLQGWGGQRARKKETSGQPSWRSGHPHHETGCAGSQGSGLCGLVGRVVRLGRFPTVSLQRWIVHPEEVMHAMWCFNGTRVGSVAWYSCD